MVGGMAGGTAALAAGAVAAGLKRAPKAATALLGVGAVGCAAFTGWCVVAREQFSYSGGRKLSQQIVEGTASYVRVPDGGTCLDVGCGSGALSIAVARRNPQAKVVGVDRWGAEYSSYNQHLCEENAAAEGARNVSFQQGDATALPFEDETFDAVTSNYVYHNVTGANKQALLRETLRCLKKGGTFAIHDIMSPMRYGDMRAFRQELLDEGYRDVKFIPTDNGLFMGKVEAAAMMLTGSTLLVGTK
ncbi:MAG: class I SAM-dependent methyltransferase [Coriobacteriia bacterium]|nr:class I SAM-dependent methyltransferase [Coriobacteriia bacterium]